MHVPEEDIGRTKKKMYILNKDGGGKTMTNEGTNFFVGGLLASIVFLFFFVRKRNPTRLMCVAAWQHCCGAAAEN
jgi:hypothetical protein